MIKPILLSVLTASAVSAQAELYDYSTTNKIYPTQVIEKTVVVKQEKLVLTTSMNYLIITVRKTG